MSEKIDNIIVPKIYKYFISILIFLIPSLLRGEEVNDSLLVTTPSSKNPFFFSLNAQSGAVFQTNDFVINEGINSFSSIALKFCQASKGDKWQDYAYGMPYFGIGFYMATFHDQRLGTPFSFYLVQGARIFPITQKISFNYEFNLGYSTNWKHYDRFDNPDNVAIGMSENIHVGANLYFKIKPFPRMDVNVGFSLSHFSNGARRLPNKGMNLAAPYIEICYNINPPEPREKPEQPLLPPKIEKRVDHDLLLTFSSRQLFYGPTNGLTTGYVDHKFRVFGLSYAPMIVSNYAFKWGPSLDIVYDESGGSTASREQWEVDGEYYDRVKLGDVEQRIGVGLSAKGELVMPYFSIFVNMGYNVYHGNPKDKPFYQIIGTKFPFYRNFFGTFGIRANHFSKAQFIFWSAGYTI